MEDIEERKKKFRTSIVEAISKDIMLKKEESLKYVGCMKDGDMSVECELSLTS